MRPRVVAILLHYSAQPLRHHAGTRRHGNPPVMAFNARYLAGALEIGSTLCLSDELSPGICLHPTGRFRVIMPMRVTIPAGGQWGNR